MASGGAAAAAAAVVVAAEPAWRNVDGMSTDEIDAESARLAVDRAVIDAGRDANAVDGIFWLYAPGTIDAGTLLDDQELGTFVVEGPFVGPRYDVTIVDDPYAPAGAWWYNLVVVAEIFEAGAGDATFDDFDAQPPLSDAFDIGPVTTVIPWDTDADDGDAQKFSPYTGLKYVITL